MAFEQNDLDVLNFNLFLLSGEIPSKQVYK